MNPYRTGWWRLRVIAGVTASAFALGVTGCSHQPTISSAAASTSCAPLPASDVPSIAKALTQTNTATYCARAGTTVLIALKAADFSAAATWTAPRITGPVGGVRWLSPPMTGLRGTTISALDLTLPGSYHLSSTARGHAWNATIRVAAR